MSRWSCRLCSRLWTIDCDYWFFHHFLTTGWTLPHHWLTICCHWRYCWTIVTHLMIPCPPALTIAVVCCPHSNLQSVLHLHCFHLGSNLLHHLIRDDNRIGDWVYQNKSCFIFNFAKALKIQPLASATQRGTGKSSWGENSIFELLR